MSQHPMPIRTTDSFNEGILVLPTSRTLKLPQDLSSMPTIVISNHGKSHGRSSSPMSPRVSNATTQCETIDSISSSYSSLSSSSTSSSSSSPRTETRTPQRKMQRMSGRGIPRVSALYGGNALDEAEQYESFQQERFKEMRRISDIEQAYRPGMRLPTI